MSTSAVALKCVFAMLIIRVPLFRIAQHIMGSRQFLKLGAISAFVGVLPYGALSEVLLYFICRSGLFDAQYLVKPRAIDRLLRTTRSSAHASKRVETTVVII